MYIFIFIILNTVLYYTLYYISKYITPPPLCKGSNKEYASPLPSRLHTLLPSPPWTLPGVVITMWWNKQGLLFTVRLEILSQIWLSLPVDHGGSLKSPPTPGLSPHPYHISGDRKIPLFSPTAIYNGKSSRQTIDKMVDTATPASTTSIPHPHPTPITYNLPSNNLLL